MNHIRQIARLITEDPDVFIEAEKPEWMNKMGREKEVHPALETLAMLLDMDVGQQQPILMRYALNIFNISRKRLTPEQEATAFQQIGINPPQNIQPDKFYEALIQASFELYGGMAFGNLR